MLRQYDDQLGAALGTVEKHISAISDQIRKGQDTVDQGRSIVQAHASHASELAKLTAANEVASEQARIRATVEQQVAKLQGLEEHRLCGETDQYGSMLRSVSRL
jgi:hypothetical protein